MFDAERPAQAECPLGELRRRNAAAQRHLARAEARVRNAIGHLERGLAGAHAGEGGEIRPPEIFAFTLRGSKARAPSLVVPNGAPYLLLVDAHDASRSALAELIRERGHRVLEAARGDDLPAAGWPPPALVVLDTGPFVDRAIQAVARMRRDAGSAMIPVLMLAPIFNSVDRDHALAAGCAECLPKPADPAELLATVDRIMRESARDAASPRAAGAMPILVNS